VANYAISSRGSKPLMTQRTMNALHEFLGSLDGSSVRFNSYRTSHDRFTLEVRPANGESFGLHFPSCLYLAGPTSWESARLRCVLVHDDGHFLYETRDEQAGFVVRSGSIVTEGIAFGIE
jgi:hypothetical protein